MFHFTEGAANKGSLNAHAKSTEVSPLLKKILIKQFLEFTYLLIFSAAVQFVYQWNNKQKL